jgi:tetratricopeptide (TPR) repeat protein
MNVCRIASVVALLSALTVASADAQSMRRQRTICQRAEASPQEVIQACTDTMASGVLGTSADVMRAYFSRANAYWSLSDWDRALADFDRAIEIAPRYAPIRINRASLLAMRGEYERALQDVDLALLLEPRAYPIVYALRGRIHGGLGNVAAAEADFERAVQLAGDVGRIHAMRARFYSEVVRDYERASASYDEAVRLEPNDAEHRNNACWERGVRLGREFDRALADCDAAIALSNGGAAPLDSRAVVRLRRGEYQSSLVDFEAALRADPTNTHSLYGRGLARLGLGLREEGQADLAAAAALDATLPAQYESYGLTP